jgi:site-specific DNA-adenine methylase
MGSKGSICDKLIPIFPKADHFYDLFGGGFSVTHAMLKHRPHDYKHFHFNEIKTPVVDLIKDALAGKYSYANFKPPWVSREEFRAKKATCGYTACIWSFGNNQRHYLFGADIEPYKKSMHQAVVFGEFDDLARQALGIDHWPTDDIKDRRLYFRRKIEWYRVNGLPDFLMPFLSPKQLQQLEQLLQLEQLERLQQLLQLEQLERLQQLEQLQQLERLNFYSKDYREIEILPNSVVYCDIPYKGTADYGQSFDHAAFHDWAASCPEPVYFSEYACQDPRFELVFEVEKRSMLSAKKSNKKNMERVFWNKKAS